jgi:hypothetical protein
LVVSEAAYGRFFDEPRRFSRQVRAYRPLFEQTRTIATFNGDGPTIHILQPRP